MSQQRKTKKKSTISVNWGSFTKKIKNSNINKQKLMNIYTNKEGDWNIFFYW